MHLAQLNIGRMRYPTDDLRVADFMDNLDRVNAIADRSPGFVWRLQDESGNATGIHTFDDPHMLVNMSVWQSTEDLERFVWQTLHVRFYRRRAEWFEMLESHHAVMWWVDPGHIPDLAEAKERLAELDENGPSGRAFGWADLPAARLWRQARCA